MTGTQEMIERARRACVRPVEDETRCRCVCLCGLPVPKCHCKDGPICPAIAARDHSKGGATDGAR